MADPPDYEAGDEVPDGLIYRRIPNHGTYYDFDNEIVHVSLFVPRPIDEGVLSAFLSQDDARASLKLRRHKGYGLCVLDIAQMKELTAQQAGVEFAPTATRFGASHVKIYGCTDEGVRDILSLIAVVDVKPEKPR